MLETTILVYFRRKQYGRGPQLGAHDAMGLADTFPDTCQMLLQIGQCQVGLLSYRLLIGNWGFD